MNATRRIQFPQGFRALLALHAVVLVVAALYFAKPVLSPLVMAILLTFLLRPGVLGLERRHVPRPLAVGAIVLGILLVAGSFGWFITQEFRGLALHLDEYRGHMRTKIESLQQHSKLKAIDNIRAIVAEVADAARPKSVETRIEPFLESSSAAIVSQAEHVTVDSGPEQPAEQQMSRTETPARKLASEQPSPMAVLRILWESFSTPLATMVVVNVLVVFILLEYEDLRNRFVSLMGSSRLTLTTRTLDEASHRISRYLVAYALVNGGFGFIVFLGLWLIGVDYALLWGFLAGTFRFVPYVGAISAAILPICMAVIQFPSWTPPLLVACLFLAVELCTNILVEPYTYGKSAGVSTVALLVAATFWAWIWGPVGLLLSVPLTVVLAVLGKHVPQLEPLGILLGNEPALEAHVIFYQRLLAGDANEAAAVFDEQLAASNRPTVYDRLIVPALVLAERDRRHGDLDMSDLDDVWRNAAELLEANAPVEPVATGGRICVAGCAAQSVADELALVMLKQIVSPDCDLTVIDAELMASEKISAITNHVVNAVVISAVGPAADLHVRYLCKRIRQESPRMQIIVGRWGSQTDIARLTSNLKECGANHVVTTLEEALDLFQRIQPMPLSA